MTEIANQIRLIKRRVNEQALIDNAVQSAKESGKTIILADHGGSVANAYGFPAETEGCVAVATPEGQTWCRVVRLPANKVTLGGVFFAVTGFRGLFDNRFSTAKKAEVRRKFLSTIVP